MEKSCRKYAPKAGHIPLSNFGKKLKTATVFKKLFYKYDSLKKDYQKVLQKLTLCFHSNPLPFNRQDYETQKRAWY